MSHPPIIPDHGRLLEAQRQIADALATFNAALKRTGAFRPDEVTFLTGKYFDRIMTQPPAAPKPGKPEGQA